MVLATACSGGGGGDDTDGGSSGGGGGSFTTGGGTLQRDAIDDYVNSFIIPTLTSLDNSAGALDAAVNQLVGARTEGNLAAARAAWVATRVPWEQNETALFGPADFYGFDPAMDSWPVNQTDLQAVLGSGSTLDAATVANLDNTLKGFHTIEYLLYGSDGSKQAGDITDRESDYLIATTDNLKSITSQLLAAWVTGIQGQQPYAEEIVKAGQGSTAFPTEAAALEQFARGMSGICDEVANGKIADPFDTRNPNIVESQFSGNSLSDFANNITGAKIAYETSLSAVVAAKNATLDTQVKAAFDAAIAAIRAIPEPFLTAIQNSANDSTIENAQQKTRALQKLIDGQVIPLLLS